MEKCLATPELRYSVFTFLRSMDLFNCAQVCKSWKDDALHVRWRYCSVGMRQLMGQLAPMEEEEEYAYYYNRLQTSLEEFDKDRWQTFLRLTSKVQVLSISTFLLHRDSVELVKELIATYGGPLFPNLRRFDIYGDWRMPPMIAFSLVPGLTSVMIDGMEPHSDYDGFEEILALVSESCKGIQDLELRPKSALFAPSFSVFPELSTLTYWSGPLFVESWNSLASCKNLAELKLLFPDLCEVAEDLLEEDLEFGALKQLYIFGMDKQTAVALLGGTRMPVLHTLRLEEVEFTEEEKKDFTENLKARCPALKRIDFVSKANEKTRFALCGVLGLLLHDQDGQAAPEICEGLSLLQHRGQDACGIVTCGAKGRLNQCKANGMVRDVFDPNSLSTLVGAMGIGHVRYPTAGSSAHSEAQPFYVNSPYGIVFAHNGNLINTADLKFFLDHEAHRHINTDSDSELLLNIFANNLQKTGKFRINEEDIFTAIGDLMHQCKGAYACVAMLAGFGIIAFRDPNGIRPVGMGRRRTPNGGYDCIVASESVVADAGGFGEWEDVRAGEAIIITRSSVSRRHLVPDRTFAPDIFEYVYFARPDSVLDGVSVYRSRMAMGENLAAEVERVLKEKDIKVDVVIPVPDTSRVSALELAQRLGLPYREGFVKNRYVGRTFIMPGQQMRKKNVRRKLNAMALEFANKVVLLVDDSIVRGTTSKEIIQMAKDVGAKKVIFASCAPPIRYSNVYGIDMPSRNELVAYERSEDEIAKALGADVVIYQTLPDLVKSVTQFNPGLTRFDCSVFDGVYVTGDVQEEYFAHLEQLRNDSAKIKQMSKGMSLPPEEVASLDNDHARGRIINGTNGVNGGPYEVHEEPLGCSGPMNGADDTVGLYNSWSVAASSKSRERSQGRSDIGGLSNFRTFST